jgi:hypothetical protein
MAEETDRKGRATMNEADIEYLRNINTRPGPNAGRSIDSSKPGPDVALTQSDAEPVAWRWRYPHGGWAVHTLKPWGAKGCIIEPLYTLAQSDAEPVAWRYKYKGERGEDPGDWFLADKQEIAASPREQIDVQPLYTTPPRPAASAADYGSTK